MSRVIESNVLPVEVRPVLNALKIQLLQRFEKQISSIIIQGSIANGDFDPFRSDIDYWVILKSPLSEDELESLHKDVMASYPEWGKKLEGSYILETQLFNREPPSEERLYFNEGYLRYERFGAEWTFERHLVFKSGLLLWGNPIVAPEDAVSKEEMILAAKTLLNNDWKGKLSDASFQWTDHYLTYGVLTMCRIVYSIETGRTGSKLNAARAVMENHYRADKALIDQTIKWRLGTTFDFKEEAMAFIRKVINDYHSE